MPVAHSHCEKSFFFLNVDKKKIGTSQEIYRTYPITPILKLVACVNAYAIRLISLHKPFLINIVDNIDLGTSQVIVNYKLFRESIGSTNGLRFRKTEVS